MKCFFAIAVTLALALNARAQFSHSYENVQGTQIANSASRKLGFHGATPSTQRAGVAQNALAITPATGTVTISGPPTGMAFASGTLAMPVNPTLGDTVTLGSLTYNFVATLTGSGNQVLIGPDVYTTAQNLAGATQNASYGNQSQGVTFYLSGSAANSDATIATPAYRVSTLIATAVATGTSGNSVASTSSFTSGSNGWAASTLSGGVAGNTVTIGSITYTFSTLVSGTIPNLVLVSGSSGSTTNLIAAINATSSLSGNAFSAATLTSTNAVASTGTSANIVSLSAALSGTAGNSIPLAKNGSNISVSGTSLSGGAQFTDTNAEANLLNEIRAALVQKGFIKGSQ